MSLFKLATLALATCVTASTDYSGPPAASSGPSNVAVATTVLTVTSYVKEQGPKIHGTALSFSLPSGLSSWVPGAPTSAPVVTVPVGPIPSDTSILVNLSSFEPSQEHNVTTIAPPTSAVNTTLVVSATANSTTGFHYGTPTGSAVATKTTGPDSGVGQVEVGLMAGLVSLAVAVLGA